MLPLVCVPGLALMPLPVWCSACARSKTGPQDGWDFSAGSNVKLGFSVRIWSNVLAQLRLASVRHSLNALYLRAVVCRGTEPLLSAGVLFTCVMTASYCPAIKLSRIGRICTSSDDESAVESELPHMEHADISTPAASTPDNRNTREAFIFFN